MKKYVQKTKKFIQKNIFNVLTILLAVISLIFSISTNFYENRNNKLPNIMLKSISNTIITQKINDDYITHFDNNHIETRMKIVNVGNGIAKNLKFSWNKDNADELKAIIKYLDKSNLVEMTKKYPIVTYKFGYSAGGLNIVNKNYYKKLDYLMSLKDKDSEEYLVIPFDYICYIEIISYLCLIHEYDFNNIMDKIKLYVDLEYSDINNDRYTKNIIINIDSEVVKYKKQTNFMFDIIADL